MSWFQRLKQGIQTRKKKEAPDGVWFKCKSCKKTCTTKDHKENLYICPSCEHHTRIGSHDYFKIIFDGKITHLFSELVSKDFLEFNDLKPYHQRLHDAREKTGRQGEPKRVGYCRNGLHIHRRVNGKCGWRKNIKGNRSLPQGKSAFNDYCEIRRSTNDGICILPYANGEDSF